jgi:hypothetical protein
MNAYRVYKDLSRLGMITSILCRDLAGQFVILRRVKLPFLIDTDTASDDGVALTTGDRGWRQQNFL